MNSELINKIEIDEKQLNQALKWLTEGKDHGLNEVYLSTVIRYLLKEVNKQ